jgi:hypothetical protein
MVTIAVEIIPRNTLMTGVTGIGDEVTDAEKPAPTAAETRYSLIDVPEDAVLRSVTATQARIDAREVLRVALDERAQSGVPGTDFIDQPTFVILPASLLHGRIEVEIRSRLLATAPDYARGFAGVAFHISEDASRFESVYLRPLNGRKARPTEPRASRAIQYFSYPAWPFDRIREEFADGLYESGADIGPDEWVTLAVDIAADNLTVTVDGIEALFVRRPLAAAVRGRIGLFVDIGTEAFFSNLVVSPTEPG